MAFDELATPAPAVDPADVNLEPQRSESPARMILTSDGVDDDFNHSNDLMNYVVVEPANEVDPATVEASKNAEL